MKSLTDSQPTKTSTGPLTDRQLKRLASQYRLYSDIVIARAARLGKPVDGYYTDSMLAQIERDAHR